MESDRRPSWNPLAGNPLRSRDDVERGARDLFAPLLPSFSPGGARVRLGHTGVLFPDAAEELEGFARPLWGLVPLALGGGRFAHWDLFRRGLASGTDPTHPEFWGVVTRDQRMVEMAAIGFGLAFLPEELWDPLSDDVRDRLVTWLDGINDHLPFENNWQFFRVLVDLGLARVGRFTREEAQRDSLARIESYATSAGWYTDGAGGHVDWYVPWALHAYGLLYAASGLGDPDHAARYRERARLFAEPLQHWFDPQGRGLPFGRSLTYRFAQSAFWGALVLADEEALPWGRVKGLLLRNLRAWSRAPIATRDGLLTLGYAYPNERAVEPYSSSQSPYWAMKAFLCLAAPADHPFWTATEEPLPELSRPAVQVPARWVVSRDASQAQALSAGQTERFWVNGAARYGKFATSSCFGFGVAQHEAAPHHNVHDSMLALRGDDGPWRVRVATEAWAIEGEWLWSRWRPWPDVVVDTVLAGRCPYHWRLHRLRTPRPLHTQEAGFALGWDGLDTADPSVEVEPGEGEVRLCTRCGVSAIRDLAGTRTARMQPALPGTNLMERRTVVPVLEGRCEAGAATLACVVLASERPGAGFAEVPTLPEPLRAWLDACAAR